MRRLAVLALGLTATGLTASCGGDDGSSAPSTTVGRIVITIPGRSTTAVPASASTSVPATGPAPAVTVVGFDTAALTIRRADGTICSLCTYVARTVGEHQQGLMGVTDLDGRDGMIFEFTDADRRSFWMKNTVMPLTAAWFGADGTYLDAYDMAPCPAGTESCPTYGPDAPALHVLEVPMGDLERLGIGDGAVLETVGGPCPLAGA